MVYGHELSSTGTRHLLGYLQTPGRTRFSQLIRWIEVRGIHLEISRGKPAEARDYCIKDDHDSYVEVGDLWYQNRSDENHG